MYAHVYACNVCICIHMFIYIFIDVLYLLSLNCSNELTFDILMYPT